MTSKPTDATWIRDAVVNTLPDAVRQAVAGITATASPSGPVYVAAGAVRDAILGRPFVDVDLVTTADAIVVTRRALPDARLTTHARFRTASATVNGMRVDVATMRRESYERPGALPAVEPATSIEEDLRRRDFSINAIAVRLDGPAELTDPCGGMDDIETRLVRVLHDASFVDDATRIFRAFRYAARLDFAIEQHTLTLLRRDAGYIRTISGERLRRELELMLAESTAGVALESCADTGALREIHASLNWTARETEALSSPAAAHARRLPLGFALLARHAAPDEAAQVTERLRLRRGEAEAVRGIASMRDAAAMLRRPNAKPSGVVAMLERYPVAAVAAFAATVEDAIAAQLALRYLEEWRRERPILTGRDLQDLGVPEGPQLQRGLQLIRAARLDGWAHDRGDEQALALRFAKSIRDSDAMNQPLTLDLNGN